MYQYVSQPIVIYYPQAMNTEKDITQRGGLACRRAIVQAALLLCIACSSPMLNAQTVDNCMSARGEEAVTTCQTLLDKGGAGPEIYYQLSLQLFEIGRTSEALSNLDKGQTAHPGNGLLTRLRSKLEADSEEQAALRASAKKNEAAMSRGQLKLACLTKSSKAGLDACNGYLSMTNVDGDRIRTRAAEIASTLGTAPETQAPVAFEPPTSEPSVVSVAPEPELSVFPTPVAIPELNEQPLPTQPEQFDATQIAMRELIYNVQSGLSSLGFDVGTPDGISGPRTRAAVAEFYLQTRQTSSDRLDDQTLVDIQAASNELNTANGLLEQSRDAASSGRTDDAIALLDSAETTSGLFRAPTGYRQNLQLAAQTQGENSTLASTDTIPQTPVPEVTAPSTSTVSPSADNTNISPELVPVHEQIQSLTASLALKRSNNQRQLQAMRDELGKLFR